MRLPTEAEWEYAARAGSSATRHGDLDAIAWHKGNSEGKTHEVGGKQANAWGLSDMLGNVWEWVADWYADQYSPGSVTDPQGPPKGVLPAARGGARLNDSRIVCASTRLGYLPAFAVYSIGVRCAGNAESLAEAPTATADGSGSSSSPQKAITPATGAPKALLAGTTKVNAKDGLAYAWIPPTTFQMGCSQGDSECGDSEKPAHQVTITKGFWMGQTEVTQEAYQRVMGTNPSNFKGSKLPVENVCWNDSRSYCEAAGMRLSSEAEWEYAARAGTGGSRYGDLDAIAWHRGNSGAKTHEVREKQANAWGLSDMLGNVSEWVSDWYALYPQGNATDPQGPVNGTERALRGVYWSGDSRYERASYRYKVGSAVRDINLGFRCAGNIESITEAPAAIVKGAGNSQPPVEKAIAPATGAPLNLTAGAKVNSKDGLTYVWIPPGTFQMGCSPGDSECFDREKPAHQVTITKGFWIGQTEVTQEAWQRVMGTNPSHSKGAELPVDGINWSDAMRYCEAVGMRLPTEGEWEYAARAGTSGSRYGELATIAWVKANCGNKAHKVSGKQANPWGLHDMLGNVWEWVADWYSSQYQAGDATDPQGPASGTERSERGGSWHNDARFARASFRQGIAPEKRFSNLGFRCGGN